MIVGLDPLKAAFLIAIFGAILALLFAIACQDARHFTISPAISALLALTALAWGWLSPTGISLGSALIGAGIGIILIALPILIAEWRRRRWPVMPGDALVLGCGGLLLGPFDLAIGFIVTLPFALAYFFWLARKRGRPLLTSYAPLAPALCSAIALMFVFRTVKGLT